MSQPVSSDNQPVRSRHTGIEFLSEPSDFSMADEWYEFVTEDHFWFKWRFEILTKLIPLEYDWGKVLDIGCGNGIVGGQMEKFYGQKTSGCDLNLKALQMNPPQRGPLYFYNIHQRHLTFEKSFSNVLLFDVLEHIDDPVAFLDSIKFHLKPGGRVVINVPALPWLYSKYDKVAGHVQRYTRTSLRRELDAAGFDVEKMAAWGMSMVPLLLIRKFILCFCPEDKVIKTGFQPMSPLVGRILDFMRRVECKLFSNVPIGSSLMVVARKRT